MAILCASDHLACFPIFPSIPILSAVVGSQLSNFFKSLETIEYMVVHQLNTGTIIRNVKKPKI